MSREPPGPGRPDRYFDVGLQHERTALAWERTAIAMMVAGVILARYAAVDAHPGIAVIGVAQIAVGGTVLLWAAWHYEDLHGPLREGNPVVHPIAARIVGLAVVGFSTVALVLAILVAVARAF